MKNIQSIIKEKAIELGVEYRPDYSGRGMYNRSCIGVVGAFSDCMDVIKSVLIYVHNAELDCGNDDTAYDFESALGDLLDYNQDSMGRSVILYWPSMQDD